MSEILNILATAPPSGVRFVHGAVEIDAADIRAAARRAMRWMEGVEGDIFLHTDSAAMTCATLLAAAASQRRLCILPHLQPAYLDEVGADAGRLLGDAGAVAALAGGGRGEDGATYESGAVADLEVVFYTSGSTGTPKQVIRRMSQLDREAAYWLGQFGAHVDNIVGTVSHQHMYGFTFSISLAVLARWRAADRQTFTWESLVTEMSPTSLVVTSPAHLSRIPPMLAFPHGRPAAVVTAGQLLPLQAATATVETFGMPALEVLGSTETGAVATRRRRDDAEPWTPLPGMMLALDEDGALEVRSPFVGDEVQRMGDRAAFLADGRFHLKGRADRVVKIAGNRVSLTRVEDALTSLPEIVEAAAVGLEMNAGGALGAVLVLDPAAGAQLARQGAFRFSRDLRQRLADRLDPAERPKRWRFVGRMPVNAQGKRVAADMAQLFAATPLLEVLGAQIEATGDDSARVGFAPSADLPWFDGHFPGQPILPGVAQAHFAVRAAEEIWGFLPGDFQVSRLKFRRIIQPDDQVVMTLTRDVARGRLVFVLSVDGEEASGGVVGSA